MAVEHLNVRYGSAVAVDDVSLSVSEGEIFGVLGPNGAGKTTTVECVTGLRTAESGSIRVLGLDPALDHERLAPMVGVQLQASTLPARLTVGEILALYRSFYPEPADVGELVDVLGLAGKQRAAYRSLSGGQQQRLSIALALIGSPKLAVLDEMTTGLDPEARRETWELIDQVRRRGVTILLVTHFMDEAERLCDRVAVLDRGRVIAQGTPQALAVQAAGAKQVSFAPSGPFDDAVLLDLPEVASLRRDDHRMVVQGSGDLVNAVILALNAIGVAARGVAMSTTSLEDAFLALTGRDRSPPADSAARPGTPSRPPAGRRQRLRQHRTSLLPGTTPRRAFGALLGAETKLAWRQPVGLAVGLGLPVALLLVFGLLPAFQRHRAALGGLTEFDVYVPTLIALIVGALAFFSLPTPLATYREQGILRRLSATPVPPAWVLAAQLAIQLAIAVAALVIVLVVGTTAFSLAAPASIGGLAVTTVLTVTAVFAIGLLIAGSARTATIAGGIGWAMFYPLMFFAGLFVPLQSLPAALQDVARYTPLGASAQALQRSIQAAFPTAAPLLVLAGYTAIFGYLAVRFFRWE